MDGGKDLREYPAQKQRQRNGQDNGNVDGNDVLDGFFDVGINASPGDSQELFRTVAN
ncbi:hypothetical protein ACFQRK_00270 [Parapedobacter sp. GCM10030251]|uniref:hypothetical protein n=1 Tax=Parapedobacter sp. GCM10030251 TaxID=3273419 RepID=UPI0036117534